MSREELLLLQQLKQLSNQVPGFALEFANHDLSVEAEIAFVHKLTDMAEAATSARERPTGTDH